MITFVLNSRKGKTVVTKRSVVAGAGGGERGLQSSMRKVFGYVLYHFGGVSYMTEYIY